VAIKPPVRSLHSLVVAAALLAQEAQETLVAMETQMPRQMVARVAQVLADRLGSCNMALPPQAATAETALSYPVLGLAVAVAVADIEPRTLPALM
jgi:hypothetical protein